MRVKRGSWVSLFAMLMIFIGPLISQAMPMGQAVPAPMSLSMDMGEPGCHGAAQHPGEHRKAASEQHLLWEKCGYCSLLFNCPALPTSLSFAAFDTAPAPPLSSRFPLLGHARQPVFPGARTRAPPIIR